MVDIEEYCVDEIIRLFKEYKGESEASFRLNFIRSIIKIARNDAVIEYIDKKLRDK